MRIQKAPEGGRHDLILKECFRIAPLIAAGAIAEDYARGMFVYAAETIGKGAAETERLMDYALAKNSESVSS